MHGLTGGGWKRKRRPRSPRVGRPGGKLREYRPWDLPTTTPPRLPPTLHRIVVSSTTFDALDYHMWKLTYKWAKFRHPNKSKRWIVNRYFGMFNKSRRDRWVFGDRATGAYLLRFSWTKIVRHTMVKGWASPDDPTLTDYWDWRRGRKQPVLDRARWRALRAQHGRCPLCGGLLLHADAEPQTPDDWEQWSTVTRLAIRKHAVAAQTGPSTPYDIPTFRLIHTGCQRRLTRGNRTRPVAPPATGQ